jgi:hypothetical protein
LVRYIQNPDVVLREEDVDGALLFNPNNNQIKMLNATGIFIWKLFDGQRDIPEIVKSVQSSFEGVPAEGIETQVSDFVDQLVNERLLGTVAD